EIIAQNAFGHTDAIVTHRERPRRDIDVDTLILERQRLCCRSHKHSIVGVLYIFTEKRLWRVIDLRGQDLQNPGGFHVEYNSLLSSSAHLFSLAAYLLRSSATDTSFESATMGSSRRRPSAARCCSLQRASMT